MRVAHVDAAGGVHHRIVNRPDLQLDAARVHRLGQGDLVPFEARRAHIDRHLVGTGHEGGDQAGIGLQHHVIHAALAHQQPAHAAAGIAAGVHLAPIGVPDAHEGVGLGRGFDGDHLVAAGPRPAIGDRADLRLAGRKRHGAGLDHGEVVAQPVHLEKRPAHRADI